MKHCPITFLLMAALCASNALHAAVRLPKLFSDNMVLQRDQPIRVWGWADPKEVLTVSLGDHNAEATADDTGKWHATLPALPAGGPHTLSVRGAKKTVDYENVLLGDVWVCSGQSNMEWPLARTDNADAVIVNSRFPKIRLFTVERDTSFLPKEDVSAGQWVECQPSAVADFSAVAYYFGRELRQALDVPIGLIDSTWGGTGIQTWTSWDVMSRSGNYADLDLVALQQQAEESDKNRHRYLAALNNDPGTQQQWYLPGTDTSDWNRIGRPGRWADSSIGDADGIVWYRTTFRLSANLAGEPATLRLSPIDDSDITYLNGERLGSTEGWDAPREYAVPAGALRSGLNTVSVKVVDSQGAGGFHGDASSLRLEVGDQTIPLNNQWLYKPSVLSTDYGIIDNSPNAFPSQLFNAMIHPLVKFPITGAIWYQGESNAGQAYRYREMFTDLIKDWRRQWGRDFPFYWAQLANFRAPTDKPAESAWAELREAQDLALALPRTGQSILIDIGDADDIHPRNKKDVGNRLALVALNDSYGKDVVYSGPRYASMQKEGSRIVLSFDHVDGGLLAQGDKYGYLKGFAIAGEDRDFHWAQARIEGENIVVSSPQVPKPVAVRYAWATNPHDANLYNAAGLPAAPFRTDDWPISTQP